jgi:hypothetical protein
MAFSSVTLTSHSTSSDLDHEQSSHDQRFLRHSLSSPIPQGQPVQDRRAHRDRCAHSRRGSKNLVWLRTASSNDFTQSLSASRSDSPPDCRNASRAVGNRRNFRRGIKNALRSSRNGWVSRYGWIGRLGLFGDLRCPETTTHLNRGTGGSVERMRCVATPARPCPSATDQKIDDEDDDDHHWAQGARMRIAGRGYKAGRFTYLGNAALPPPPDTDTSPGPARAPLLII